MRLGFCIAVAILFCITSHVAFADASTDLRRASGLLAKAKPAEAVAVLDAAIPAAEQSKDAKIIDLRILLAKCHIAAKDWDKAGAATDTVAADKPEIAQLLKGAVLQGKGKNAEALDEIHAALLALDAPTDTVWVTKVIDSIKAGCPKPGAATLEKLGDCYRIENGFAKAYPCYEAALKQPGLAPDTAKGMRRWLIKCHIRARQFAKVAKEIDAIVAESPEVGPWSYYGLANYYRSKRKYKDALAAYSKIATLPPTLIPGRAGKAAKMPGPALKTVQIDLVECYTGLKQWDKATELLKTLSTQYPKEAAHWHEAAGAIYQGQKKYPEAIAELKQAIEPKTATGARKRLGDCYKASLGPKEAAPLIKELVDKYPEDGPYLPTIAGRMYQDMKDYAEAITLFKFVIDHFPDARWQVWDACYYIGECCFAQSPEKGEEAMAYIKGFYAKHPDRPMDFAIAYGKTLLYPAGRAADAAQVLEKVLAENPKDKLVSEVRPMLLAAYSEAEQIGRLADLLASLAAETAPSRRPKILLSLANRYVQARKYKEAASACRGVMALPASTKDARAHAQFLLAVCYHGSSMTSAAQQAMRNVESGYPGSVWAARARATLAAWEPK